MKKITPILFLFLTLASQAQVKKDSLNLKLADLYFKITNVLCSLDNGELWGTSLYGPSIFVDPTDNSAIANQADFWGNLTPSNGLYRGQLPDEMVISNNILNWGGLNWACMQWPLNVDKTERNIELLKLQFLRFAPSIGISQPLDLMGHIDSTDARLLIQLEWRALNKAIHTTGTEKKNAVNDALLFRNLRHTIYPDGAVVEIQLEKLYGLAEYTALKLSKLTDEQVMERIALKINTANKLETFEGILGETSGLFYAMLLDASGMIWRKEVNATCDLGELTRKDYLLARSQNLDADAEKASQNYGIKQLKATEAQRAKEAETKKTAFSKLLIDGNVCTIPLENAKLSFDPRSSIPFGVIGTVYPNIIVDDNWGRLIVKNGALVNNAITRLCVSAKDLSVASQNIETEYFILELKDGWRFVPGKRNGDYELIK